MRVLPLALLDVIRWIAAVLSLLSGIRKLYRFINFNSQKIYNHATIFTPLYLH